MVVAVGEADPSVALVLAQHTLFHALLDDMPWPDAQVATMRSSAIEGVALVNALRVEPELGTPRAVDCPPPSPSACRTTPGGG